MSHIGMLDTQYETPKPSRSCSGKIDLDLLDLMLDLDPGALVWSPRQGAIYDGTNTARS